MELAKQDPEVYALAQLKKKKLKMENMKKLDPMDVWHLMMQEDFGR